MGTGGQNPMGNAVFSFRGMACLTGLMLMGAGRLAAQESRSDAFLLQQRALEEQVRAALNRERPADQRIEYDWGGWYSFYLFLFDDGIESSRTFRQHDFRLWGSANIDQGAHEIYGRLKLQFEDFNHGDAYDRNHDDTIGPNLDRAFYKFDLRQAARAYWNQSLDWDLSVKVGRDFVELGTGYALSMPLDHVLIVAEAAKLKATALMGTTIRSMPDIDRGRPGGGSSERNFWGGQLEYTGLQKHTPFVYGLINKDQKTEHPWVPMQNFDYDTWYVGVGSRGELLDNLRYSTEWVWEGGESFGDRHFLTTSDVEAWAFDFLLEYLSRRAMKPRIWAEYMFASGDGGRYASPTNAIGGNTSEDDTGFSAFGYRDTGLSFAPRLSNVHVWRAGAAFRPFENHEYLSNLEIGTDWFLYSKHHRDGAVSDPTANARSNYLGWEMDYFLNWRITADLAWTTRFGTFFPGKGFDDATTRTFFLTGVTYSF
ncbi:MAG: hypothetical protein AMXMBFR83_04470 [Phycisphaerae bacterium]